ncbi:MAG: FMN-binding protein [Muribaculaceae bacterium]|nr:FMN-binding protein [Muribaculaceae bacterium]
MTKFKFAFFAVAIIAAAVFAPNALAKGKTSAPQVIYTGEIAKKVVGYNGTTPVSISITDGRITSITALDNKETPSYFNRAKEKVFKQFIGKTVDEALNLKADVATGATYSSDALIKNIKMGLQQAKDNSPKQTNKKGKNKKGKGKRSMTK